MATKDSRESIVPEAGQVVVYAMPDGGVKLTFSSGYVEHVPQNKAVTVTTRTLVGIERSDSEEAA